MNVIVNKNTKGKSTDNIIRKILTEIYMQNPSYDIVYNIIEDLLGQADNMHIEIKEDLGKISWNILQEFQKKYNLDTLLEQLFNQISWKPLRDLTVFLKSKWKSSEIELRYWLSNVTIKSRLINQWFFDKELVKEKNYSVLYLKPKPETLILIAIYWYLKKKDITQNNLFHKIINIFEGK